MSKLEELLKENPELAAEFEALAEEKAAGLKTNRDKAHEARIKAQNELNAYNELGGLDTFKTLLEKQDEAKNVAAQAEKERIEASGDINALNESHKAQVASLHDTITGLQSSMVNDRITAEVNKAISSHNGISDLLEPVVMGRIAGKMTDVGVALQINNTDGSVMLNEDGTQANVNDLVKSLKSSETLGVAFKATGKSGTGSVQSSAIAMAPDVILDPNAEGFNLTAALEYSAKNPEAAKNAARDAGVQVDD